MEFICLDIETTGLDSKSNEIIEVAAVKFNEHEILEEYQTFINFTGEIPPIIEHLTGINIEMTKNAPTLEQVKNDILNFCQDHPIVGHNINFDIDFLKAKGVVLENTLFDTLPLSHILIEETPSHSLEVLCRKFNKQHFPTHRALDDCLGNIELFHFFINKIRSLSPESAYLWKQVLSKSTDQWSKILQNLVPDGIKPNFIPNPYVSSNSQLENLNTNFSIENYSITEKIKSENQNSLFVVTESTKNKIDSTNYTYLNSPFSEISHEKFLDYLNNNDLNYDETLLMLKISNQICHKSPLYKSDLNLANEDFAIINYLVCTNYNIPKSEYPYLISHFDFIKLFNENLLPSFENIYFEEIPFIKEVFIRASEKFISLFHAENGVENLHLALQFRNLAQVGRKLKATENAEFGDSTLLDNYTFNFPEIQTFLNEILENTTNTSLKENILNLKNNFSQYLIYIREHQDGIATLGYTPKQISTDNIIEQLTLNCSAKQFNLIQNSANSEEIFLNIPENFPEPNEFSYNKILANYLLNELKGVTKQAIVISPANVQINYIHKNLALELNKYGINLLTQNISGSKGKILDNLENQEAPTVLLCTQYFFLRNFPDLPELEKLFITKLPMGLPNHIYFEYQKKINSNSFMELVVPQTAQTIYQIISQAKTNSPSLTHFELLDVRLKTKSWGEEIYRNFPKNIILNNCQ